MLKKVLQISKSVDDEKVGVSFQMPKGLKMGIDKLCAKNGIKLTTFFNSLAQVALDELQGVQDMKQTEFKRLATEKIEILNERITRFNKDPDPDWVVEYTNDIAERDRLRQLLK